MPDLADIQIDAALEKGRGLRALEPRAKSVRYDEAADRVIVNFDNDCTFAFPPRLAEGLAAASPSQLASVEILGNGDGLHWSEIDVDLSIPGLMSGIFGTRSWIARQAGQSTSPAKAAAARRNGAKGGRPRKQVKG